MHSYVYIVITSTAITRAKIVCELIACNVTQTGLLLHQKAARECVEHCTQCLFVRHTTKQRKKQKRIRVTGSK